jgi:hypothetical protein
MIQPITAEIAKQLTTPPPSTSKDIWLYELGRFLIQKTNAIIVALFQDSPPCSPGTCPEMRASEWQYLCAVHDPPKSCAAIDYCCHTLDWAATTLTSSKMFPSRLGLGSGSGSSLPNDKILIQQMKEIKNIFRRVYRIYAHAWFQHREMFWRVELKTGLYVFFKTVCDEYDIIGEENYTIPKEAEGFEPEPDSQVDSEDVQTPMILQRETDMPVATSPKKATSAGDDTLGLGDTTKRHRHTKSDFSRDPSAVIKEEAEEEDPLPVKPPLDRQTTALKDMVDQQPEAPVDAPADEPETQDEPAIGIARSDTIKAGAEEAMAEDKEGEETVVEATTTTTEEAPKQLVVEGDGTADSSDIPQEQSAAEPGDAPKSVDD